MDEPILIGIGSNLGDRLAYIRTALEFLQKIMRSIRCSTLVESQALLLPESPPEWDIPYLNCAVMGFSDLSPRELLGALKNIEREMDALKTARWAPRKIDLDILAYGDQVIQEEDLTIPHKGLLERPFALFPVGQLLPHWRYPVTTHPSFGKTALELMHQSVPEFGRTLLAKPHLVGILNVTPDSFSDGGLFQEPERAVAHAKYLWESGAALIDVGASSTRPGAALISHEEEWSRLYPVLKGLRELPNPLRLSIDTYDECTAIRAIAEFDVDAINFVGPRIGPQLALQIKNRAKQLICMHSLSLPPCKSKVLPFDQDPISLLLAWAKNTIADLENMGLDRKQLILDPGIGFGKTTTQNFTILKRIQELKQLGVSLLVGHSRKSFMNVLSSDRDWLTAALSIPLMNAGVDYLRVHDVRKTMDLLGDFQHVFS